MKNKSKIVGVAVTVVLLASLFGFALPVAAEPGNMQWVPQPLPTATGNVLAWGTDVTDVAVASDGKTIYVINAQLPVAVANVFKSGDGGQSFVAIPIVTANPLRAIAVAPDDPNVIAVIEATPAGVADVVHISTSGGVAWGALPALPAAVDAMDVAVGPARAGTLLGREYVVALANPAAGFVGGDVAIIGGALAWASVDPVNVLNRADYMAVAFSPNFIADRCVVAVGACNAGSVLQIINTNWGLQIHPWVVLNANVRDFGAAANGILSADIALPCDFDPTAPATERSYACTASAAAANDGVYRVDNIVRWELGLAGMSLHSVAYSGTVAGGTLFVGGFAAPAAPGIRSDIRFSTNPIVAPAPWAFSQKSPTGANGLAVVRVAALSCDPAPSAIFAGTSGTESAFAISTDGGISFNEEALIDMVAANNLVNIQGVALTPGGGDSVFVLSDDGTHLNVWKSAAPVTPYSWSRVWCVTGTTGLLALNPDWAAAPVIFLADLVVGGNIYVSKDAGAVWVTRWAPAGVTATAIGIQDANIAFLGDALGNVYKATPPAWTWLPPAPGLSGAIVSLQVPKADHVLLGGTGSCSYSTDGGSTFTQIPVGLAPAPATYIVLADEDYATNNITYAGGSNGVIYRFTIGTSAAWENLINPTAVAIVGMAMNNGALYGMSAASCDRTLAPHEAPGTALLWWDVMNVGAPAAVANFSAVGNKLYAANAAVAMWAYDDWLATATPSVTSPADGYDVNIDPVTGRAEIVYIRFNAMGSSTGLVNAAQVLIWETPLGIGSAVFGAQAIVVPVAPTIDTATMGIVLRANTEYSWMLRASNQVSGDAVVSPWSAPRTLEVQAGVPVVAPHVGPELLGPAGGAMNVPLRPGFSWAPLAGTTKYQFILATDAALTETVGGTPVEVTTPSWQCPTDLEYGTTYFWAVKGIEPGDSPQSVGTFTTIEAPVPPAPPPPTPAYIWAIIVIGAILVIVVLVLIVRTRRAS